MNPLSSLDVFMGQVWAGENGCAEWRGRRTDQGYGQLSNGDFAHRVAWELFVGPIPAGFQIDHLCRNRRCVNPEHFELVVPKENVRRGWLARDPFWRCRNGHAGSPNTVYLSRGGRRRCRICDRSA